MHRGVYTVLALVLIGVGTFASLELGQTGAIVGAVVGAIGLVALIFGAIANDYLFYLVLFTFLKITRLDRILRI